VAYDRVKLPTSTTALNSVSTLYIYIKYFLFFFMDQHSASFKPSSKATVMATGVVSTYFVILNSLLYIKLNYDAFAYSATDVKLPPPTTSN
jgi:hypothetical protein